MAKYSVQAKVAQKAKRKEVVILRLIKGEPLREILVDYPDLKLKSSTWTRLRKGYEKEGLRALIDRRKGISHKLRPEIREFILNNKKSNPKLSCRKLVGLVREKFWIDLSKSYINQIIRKAKLGIPPVEVIELPSKPVVSAPKVIVLEVKPVPEPVKPPSEPVKPPPEPVKPPPPKIEPPLEKIEPVPKIVEPVSMDYAGCFFLKGADSDITGSYTITKLVLNAAGIKEVLPGELTESRESLQRMNELILYLPIFGLRLLDELTSSAKKPLSILTGGEKFYSPEVITSYLKGLEGLGLFNTLAEELRRCCMEALAIKVKLEDGSTFYVDCQLNSVWPDKEIPKLFSVSLNKAKSYVTRFFLDSSTDDPLILSICPGYIRISPGFFHLMKGFGGERAITEVSIIDSSGLEIESFKGIKPIKRYFITYLSPWQYRGLESFRIKENFLDWHTDLLAGKAKIADAEISLKDSLTHKEYLLRAALAQTKTTLEAVTTNLTDQEVPEVGKIATSYFHRWPWQLGKTFYRMMQQGLKKRSPPSPTEWSGPFTLIGFFRSLLNNLNRYAQVQYFPPECGNFSVDEMTERFYKQSGSVMLKEDSIEVTLSQYEDPVLQKAIEYACDRFNRAEIKMPANQKIHISSIATPSRHF